MSPVDLNTRLESLLGSRAERSDARDTPAPMSDGTVRSLEEEVRVAQSLHLVGQLPALVLGNVGGAAVAFLALVNYVDWRLLVGWVALIWLLCAPMAVNWLRLHRKPAPDRVSHRRIRRATAHSFVLGLAWALILVFLASPGVPMEVRVLTATAQLVLAVGASVAMAPIPAAALAYMLPVLLPMMVFVGLGDDSPMYSHTVMNLFISFASLSFMRQGWINFRRSVATAQDRAMLSDARAREIELRKKQEQDLLLAKEAAEKAASEVRSVQRRLQSIVEALPYPVAIFSRGDARVLYANRRTAELLALPLGSVYQIRGQDFFADRTGYEQLLTGLQSADVVAEIEVRLKHPAGNELWTRLSAIAMTYEGEPAVLSTIEDVTERKRHELEMRAARDQAEAASRAKSQFLANMSHELRTPLNAVIGYSELMSDGVYGDMPERAVGVLERIEANSRHLLGLINDVLDLSRIEAGQIVLATEPYDLAEIAHSVHATTESLARAKQLDYRARIEPGMPAGAGDARRLTQVLLNLAGNAIKFTERGWIEIRAHAQGNGFVVEVEDTGPGIDPKDHARIFEEFQQVDNTSTRNKGGSGLGLAISRRIIELHGGTLELESEPGKGSVFRARWPARVG